MILDIGKASPHDFVSLLRKVQPRVVVWAAGTGNNDLAKYIDYGAQVKVYDAMVKTKIRRVVTISSMGVWDWKSDGAPWFSQDERKSSLSLPDGSKPDSLRLSWDWY